MKKNKTLKSISKIIEIQTDKKHELSRFFLNWPLKKQLPTKVRGRHHFLSPFNRQSTKRFNFNSLFMPRRSLWPGGDRIGLINFLPASKNKIKKIQILFFVILLLALVAPFEAFFLYSSFERDQKQVGRLVEESIILWQQGYEQGRASDFTAAVASFSQALNNFTAVERYLSNRHPLLWSIMNVLPRPPKQYVASKNILISGQLISRAGARVSALALDWQSHGWGEDNSVEVEKFYTVFTESSADIRRANAYLATVDSRVLPPGKKETFDNARQSFDTWLPQLNNINDILALLKKMSGFGDGPARWLLVFQNDAELRASGGFMGSYGFISAYKGQVNIVDMPGGGTYDLQGSLRKTVISPEPLHLINPVWQFQDANWWPDWPTSARKIAWFYEASDGATPDGVVSFTPYFLERLLNIIGEIDLTEKYDLVVNKFNVYEVLQELAEAKDNNEPKQVIADLTDLLIKRLGSIDYEQGTQLIKLMVASLDQKQLLLYWADDTGRAVLARNGWDGSIKQTSPEEDYLLVAHSNIAGGKSDKVTKDLIDLQSQILSDGSIRNTLTITRTHHGQAGFGFSGVRNVDYLRVYVPRDSTLIRASGFSAPVKDLFENPPPGWQIDEDYSQLEELDFVDEESGTEIFSSFNKTVFANWLMVDPGNSTTVVLEYTLPFVIKDLGQPYGFYLQKQAGWQGAQFHYNLSWPEHWPVVAVDATNAAIGAAVSIDDIIDQDIEYFTHWQNKKYAQK